MNPRVIGRTKISGVFSLPIGIEFKGTIESSRFVEVSTVCLENGHLEDPTGIIGPEHGYETMVFLDGCSFFSIHTAQYPTELAARIGHKTVVSGILNRTLPLSILVGPGGDYTAFEASEDYEKATVQ